MTQEVHACPRCRAPLPANAAYCLRCGARVSADSPGMTVLKVLWSFLLAGAALSLAAFGACSLLLVPASMTGSAGGGAVFLALALGALALSGWLVSRVVANFR